MCEGGTLLLGEAGVDGRGLPQLQSLLHTFQQAPATGRPGVYLTTGLNGPEQQEGKNQRFVRPDARADVWTEARSADRMCQFKGTFQFITTQIGFSQFWTSLLHCYYFG